MGKVNARLVNRELITPELGKFSFYPVERPLNKFVSGQYTALMIYRPGMEAPVGRPYSIASHHHDRDIELYVRWVTKGGFRPDGKGLVTTELFGNHTPDTEYFLTDPTGRFVFDEGDPRDALLIGTGTGIVPILSIVRDQVRRGDKRRIMVVHGVSHMEDLAYDPELSFLGGSDSPMNLHYDRALSKEDRADGEVSYVGQFLFHRNDESDGRISFDEVSRAISDGRIEDTKIDRVYEGRVTPGNVKAYVCGNPDMVKNIRALLAARGFNPEKRSKDIIAEEYW